MDFEVCAIGELIMDCNEVGKGEMNAPLFACSPGGAPGNVVACLSKLGIPSTFIGKVGNDGFGHCIKNALGNCGVNTDGVVLSNEHNTTLAFVQLSEDGDRSFSFYRKNCADIMLSPCDVSNEIIDRSRVLHFGSVSLTDEPSRSSTFGAAEYAKKNNKLISFDPNYRANLWDNEKDAIGMIKHGLKLADIVKLSEEELYLIEGTRDIELLGKSFLEKYDISLLLITLGKEGAYIITKDVFEYGRTFATSTIDTTGAGDAAMGALLYSLSSFMWEIDSITVNEAQSILNFVNACGALSTAKHGAIPAMPTKEEIEYCICNYSYV